MNAARSNYIPPLVTQDTPFHHLCMDQLYKPDPIQERGSYDLHYIVALGEFPAAIEECAKTNPGKLVLADPKRRGLTPLHLAAMKVNMEAAKIFLLMCKKEDLDIPCDLGFTPLHFAAMTSDALFLLFLQHGGNANLRTREGASCQDLRVLCGRATNVRSTHSLFYQEGSDHKPVVLWTNPVLREKVFGKDFFHADSAVWTNISFEILWEAKSQINHWMLKNRYTAFCQNPPSLIIAPCERLKGITDHYLEVRAKDHLSPGTILSECAGLRKVYKPPRNLSDQMKNSFSEESPYCLFDVDARAIGNESRFFNCGFPNAFVQEIFEQGMTRDLVIALEEIKPGEPILINYEWNSLYFFYSVQILLGKEKMIKFFEERGENFIALLEKADKANSRMRRNQMTMQTLVDWSRLKTAFVYPINHPTALLFLHFRNLYDYTTLLETMKSTKMEFLTYQATRPNFKYVEVIIKILQAIKKKCVGNEKQAIADWVVQNLERKPLTTILKGLDLFSQGKSVKEVEEFLSEYDWTKDKKHPLNRVGAG